MKAMKQLIPNYTKSSLWTSVTFIFTKSNTLLLNCTNSIKLCKASCFFKIWCDFQQNAEINQVLKSLKNTWKGVIFNFSCCHIFVLKLHNFMNILVNFQKFYQNLKALQQISKKQWDKQFKQQPLRGGGEGGGDIHKFWKGERTLYWGT